MTQSSLEPRNLDEAERIARILQPHIPGDNVTLTAALVGIGQCVARGWSAWDTPSMVYVYGGRVGWSAVGVRRAVLEVATAQVTCRTGERFAMTVTPRDGGAPIEIETTIQWAKGSGYYRTGSKGKTKWESDPATMLETHGWRFAERRLAIGSDGDDAMPSPAEVAAETQAIADSTPRTYGGVPVPALPAPAPTPAPDYKAALRRHSALLDLSQFPADQRKALSAALLAAATDSLIAELDDPDTTDDSRRALLCAAMGATPEQVALLVPRPQDPPADPALIAMIIDCLDGFTVVSDDARNYIGTLTQPQAQALWADLEADHHTAAGRIPGVTTAPSKRKTKGE